MISVKNKRSRPTKKGKARRLAQEEKRQHEQVQREVEEFSNSIPYVSGLLKEIIRVSGGVERTRRSEVWSSLIYLAPYASLLVNFLTFGIFGKLIDGIDYIRPKIRTNRQEYYISASGNRVSLEIGSRPIVSICYIDRQYHVQTYEVIGGYDMLVYGFKTFATCTSLTDLELALANWLEQSNDL